MSNKNTVHMGVLLLLSLLVVSVVTQCPTFPDSDVLKCKSKSDNDLCILAAQRNSDRLADFEFMDVPFGIANSDPLACKMRAAAIRQHVLYYGSKGEGTRDCGRAAVIFQKNPSGVSNISELCQNIGFSKCRNCRNGGSTKILDDGNCVCVCKHGWGGDDCSECILSAAECFHGGNVTKSPNQCECSCPYPWSGVHCEQCSRTCKHSGFVNPTDHNCQCQCQFPWSGLDCGECKLKCQHSGKLIQSESECKCDCPILSLGPQCEQCSARCLNGGVLDTATCTCKCVGGFSGHQCENCDISCQNNGTLNKDQCTCDCSSNPFTSGDYCESCSNNCHGRGLLSNCTCTVCDKHWKGPTCSVCGLRCENEGILDDRSCACACPIGSCVHGLQQDSCECACNGNWQGSKCDQCDLRCLNGVLNPRACQCVCHNFFSGVACDTCNHNCSSRGVLNSDKCICEQCNFPKYGYDCSKICTKECLHGSVMNTTACKCEHCPYPWKGEQCEVCQLAIDEKNGLNVCGPHGKLDSTTCSCTCEEGWGGSRCQLCTRSCAHGTLNNRTCSCSCKGHWTDSFCSTCPLVCENGGILDEHNCYCQCTANYSGSTCQGSSCDKQIACDSCLSVSDGCEWCAKTASCSKVPAPGTISTCSGPSRVGTCPPHGECHVCTYTPSDLHWLAANGEPASVLVFDETMPESGE